MNREELLKKEMLYLSEFAVKSNPSCLTKRRNFEPNEDIIERLDFQRDRDRIIHSRAFRRLMHKTQVFNANLGDHYRNRLTHTMEVNQIARSISKNLGLNDELTEAIALGHDLGHTPFGHIGERTLHLLISGDIKDNEGEFNHNKFGGFKHNYQSLQIVDNMEKRSNEYNGINLTLAVREGILKHTGSKIRIPKDIASRNSLDSQKVEVSYSTLNLDGISIDKPSFTLEGQVVAIADEIAQCTHDLEDGIRAKIIDLKNFKNDGLIKKICSERKINLDDLVETVDVRNVLIKYMVGELINDVCKTTSENLSKLKNENRIPKYTSLEDVYKEQIVSFSKETEELHKELSNLITKLVIASQQVTQSDLKAEYIIKRLFKAYFNHPQQLPDYILNRYFIKKGKEFNRFNIADNIGDLKSDSEFVRLICDHIGSMTDQYASREYKKLYEPEYY
ncbi:dGTP triphosphohydrolase [Tissierella sp.]|uniref:dGTP triphosphohydrolase n=1 Tax=Tissierella sp. TaxID=41274 RepID=UPI002865F702|nr:dNTP triphosphohydrolase [Tissierella sp.]MDR7856644.1 dNTP triphosphohydrolase [Tissierella sp.]